MSETTPEPQLAHVLDGGQIVGTLRRLQTRIHERFPNSGLSRVCADLVVRGEGITRLSARLARPNWGLRILIGAILAAAVAGLGFLILHVHLSDLERTSMVDIAQGMDATVNLLLLAAAGAWFVVNLEQRLKRARIHAALSELRAIAHVVDMHQLTKDPTVVLDRFTPTAASPKRRPMSEFELARYLDYCAEMQSLIAKLAALFQRANDDPEVGDEVAAVERLTSELGRKIWQKITIIGQLAARP